MTVQKSFKRLVRARMAKTGESYAAARAKLLASADEGSTDEIPQLACSDERIRERTGRGWEEWFALLDSWGAESMGHTELVGRVAAQLRVHALGWDAQAVTTSFERARGKRAVGERIGGDGFVATASKTIGAGAEQVFRTFVDARGGRPRDDDDGAGPALVQGGPRHRARVGHGGRHQVSYNRLEELVRQGA